MVSETHEEAHLVPALLDEQIDPATFAENEVQFAYYLKHLSTLANAVVMEGESRGFIDLKVWRRPKDNEPYNARILENHASLSFFYTLDRPWNPYRGNAALKARLEAVMDFWCRIQHTDGRFSEYAPEQWSLPPTGFGIKFMGETLRFLHESETAGGPGVDSGIMSRTVAAARKAIQVLLSHPDLLRQATNYSNQYTGFWGGIMAFLAAFPDAEMQEQFVEMMKTFSEKLTSPVGYHYERSGCDWRYTMATHQNNVRHVWKYVRGTELGKMIVDLEQPWMDWLSYNAVLEPDGAYFTLNRAIETRTELPGFETWETPVVEEIPITHAFAQSQEVYEQALAKGKEDLVKTWPSVGSMETYSPHICVDGRASFDWLPSEAQRDEARAKLPYLARDRYTQFRMDHRIATQYTFVRRPNYYAAFNSGEVIHSIQRYGLGLLWHPRMGSLLQTQSRDTGPWGTALDDAVYEADSFMPEITVNGEPFVPTAGIHDLPDGEVVFVYALGDVGQKTVRFAEDHIEVMVNHPGAFSEHLPLLCREGDALTTTDDQILLKREEGAMMVSCSGDVEIAVSATDVSHGPFQLNQAVISAQGQLTYKITFE